MIVYIVQMEREKTALARPIKDPHRYVVGVYTDPVEARKAGAIEEIHRSHEYKYFLHDFVLDHITPDKAQKYIDELMTENIWQKNRRDT